MSRRNRTYTEEQRQIALIFYERVRHQSDSLERAAKLADVEVAALRYWIGGGGVTIPAAAIRTSASEDDRGTGGDDGDDGYVAPGGIPMPPEYLQSPIRWPEDVVAAHDLAVWVRRHFVDEDGELVNADHRHLKHCLIAWEWTNVPCAQQQIPVAAMTRMVAANGGKWEKAREAAVLRRAWGDVPVFGVTVDAVWWTQAHDANRCCVIDHELYHCGLLLDPVTRQPRFDRQGRPKFAIRGHDFTGFLGCTERWGVDAAEPNVKEVTERATRPPRIARARIEKVCGTCLR